MHNSSSKIVVHRYLIEIVSFGVSIKKLAIANLAKGQAIVLASKRSSHSPSNCSKLLKLFYVTLCFD